MFGVLVVVLRRDQIAGPGCPLTEEWQADFDAWQKRDLSARRYVYVWADGVYLQARMEDAAECMLVLIGATPRRQEEIHWVPDRGMGERAELARASHRHQAAWARDHAGSRGR